MACWGFSKQVSVCATGPDYPAERLAYMLRHFQISLLLTQQRLLKPIPPSTVEVFYLDTDWSVLAETPTTNPPRRTTADYLAYVIYTSGSTGAPKGVMISHSAICNHMSWMQQSFPLTEHDRILQKTPFSFDASVWEFFAPLYGRAVGDGPPRWACRSPVPDQDH